MSQEGIFQVASKRGLLRIFKLQGIMILQRKKCSKYKLSKYLKNYVEKCVVAFTSTCTKAKTRIARKKHVWKSWVEGFLMS